MQLAVHRLYADLQMQADHTHTIAVNTALLWLLLALDSVVQGPFEVLRCSHM
jgi:hypothetical protein